MKCIADVHYDVIRRHDSRGREGEIVTIACKFCSFSIFKGHVSKPRSSKSGLGRYNRMRGMMVAHLHEQHVDELAKNRLSLQERWAIVKESGR